MIALVEDKREQIAALCECHRVRRLDVFGSAASGDFDVETSDVDFLVEFHPLQAGQRAEAYFGLLEGLEVLLAGRVDLVMRRAIQNPYFLQAIEAGKELLYAA